MVRFIARPDYSSRGGSVWLDGARCHWLGRPGQSDGPGTGGPAIAILEVSNLDTIIGQQCVQPVRHGGDQCFQEAHGDRTIGLLL